MTILLFKYIIFDQYSEQTNPLDISAVFERQLLLQFGERLRRLRKAQALGTVEMARRVGISRTTLAAVENGDPGPSIGTYLRVMTVLGIGGELALLAGDALQPAPAGSAGARSRRARPRVQVLVTADDTRHALQDMQSLALHEEAVRRILADPALLRRAQETLDDWISSGPSRSRPLWTEWRGILKDGQWRKVLARSRRAQELRQASPIVTVIPEDARQAILKQVSALKKGVTIMDALADTGP